MSWGADGEEIRDKAKTELALVKIPLYRLHQVAQLLKHPDKGPTDANSCHQGLRCAG